MYTSDPNPENSVMASIAVLLAGLAFMAIIIIGTLWPNIVALFY